MAAWEYGYDPPIYESMTNQRRPLMNYSDSFALGSDAENAEYFFVKFLYLNKSTKQIIVQTVNENRSSQRGTWNLYFSVGQRHPS